MSTLSVACLQAAAVAVVVRGYPEVFPVKGVVHELTEAEGDTRELDRAASRLRPWAGGAKAYTLVVTPVDVTGRRIVDG
jgi:hypothetical protein